jgi:hypothetical protein
VQAGMTGNVVGRQRHVDGLVRFRHSHRFEPELEPLGRRGPKATGPSERGLLTFLSFVQYEKRG